MSNATAMVFRGMEDYFKIEYAKIKGRMKRRVLNTPRKVRMQILDEGRLSALKEAGKYLLLTDITKP